MAPSKNLQPHQHEFEKDEKCLCFHGQYLYEAKILDKEHEDPKDKKSSFKYRVHYKGWKNTWDDWVNGDRLRKLNDENKEFAKSLFADLRQKQREEREAKEGVRKGSAMGGAQPVAAGIARQKKKSLGGSELGSLRGSEERSSSAQAQGPRGTKRAREWDTIEKEETFTHRPSVRIPIPDHLKGLLVDDWENVTKQLQLVPLPHPHPVSAILAAYTTAETPKRRPGSADADILEEVVQGVREYFDKCLGRILLYRFERQQWLEVHDKMAKEPSQSPQQHQNGDGGGHAHVNEDDAEDEDDDAKLAGKSPSDVYGAEHLCRLFVSMPELIAQTNMDAQSVGRLREELAKMTQWLARNSGAYFTKIYMDPGTEYVERAKGTG